MAPLFLAHRSHSASMGRVPTTQGHMGSFHCPELPRDTCFVPPELLVIILLGVPFTSFLGFFNSRPCLHSLRDSNTKALGGNSSSQLLFAPVSEAVTPLSKACAVCPAVWFGCLLHLVHPVVVISMEEGASSPACSPPHTRTRSFH